MNVADYSANEFYNFYYNEKSEDVRAEVETHLASIQYEWDLVSDLELSKIEHEILHLSDIMRKSYLMDIENDYDRMNEAVRYYEEIIEYDEEHLYFLLDTEGNLLRSGTDDSINGTNLIDSQDINGTYFARDILEAVNNPNGIYTSYYWPKEANGEPKEKISFCYYISEFDIIVGTGIYMEDIFLGVQENVYRRLNEYYRDKENYVFIYTYEGLIKVGPTIEDLGSNAKEIIDLDGYSVHDIFMTFLDSNNNGYVNYEFTRKGGSEKLEKVSYISKIEGWDAYIGMGFYTEDINIIYNTFEDVSRSLHLMEIRNLGILLMTLLLLVVLLINKSKNIQHDIFKSEESTYSVLFDQISDGIIVMISGQIVFVNPKTKEYLGDDIGEYIEDGQLNLVPNEDGYIVSDRGNSLYYLEVKEKKMYFRGHEGTLYLIEDITKSYGEIKQYMHLSTVDELTQLPNRRMLKYDCDNLKKSGKCNKVVGLIDLDFFKVVNDMYGHDIGDLVLIELANVFKERLRSRDGFYRYGGEEFIVMIDSVELDIAAKLLMEINHLLSERIKEKFGFIQTFSGGIVATSNIEDPNMDDIIKKADELLYEAKANGRNQVRY